MARISDISIMLFPWGVKNPSVHEIVDAAKLAEELGFYSVTLPTHMTMPPTWLFRTFPNRDVLDAMVVVPAIAAATSSIKIGFNSVLLPLLPPYQWAKYLATLDVMSGGRLIVGAAMGWWEEDFAAVGVERKRRGRQFDEQLEVITRLWTQEKTTFEGQFYQLNDMPLEPKPIQKPYPSIWIGGGVKSIGRAARYGESILCFWPDEEQARSLWIPKLQDEGSKWGTEPKLVSFTFAYVAEDEQDFQSNLPKLREGVAFEDPSVDPMGVTISGVPQRCAQRINALMQAGVAHFVVEFQFHGLESVSFGMRQMERFARDVAPLL
ncbi:MAG: LLM class flavin-dependent oxidoreductase [Acidiferrobacterales bacterium]